MVTDSTRRTTMDCGFGSKQSSCTSGIPDQNNPGGTLKRFARAVFGTEAGLAGFGFLLVWFLGAVVCYLSAWLTHAGISGSDRLATAVILGLMTFVLAYLVVLILAANCYGHVGQKAYRKALATSGASGGWFDFSFFYYAFQVVDLPVVRTRFAPEVKAVRQFQISSY